LVICVVSKKIPKFHLTQFLLGIILDLKLIIKLWDYLIMLTTNGYKTKIMYFCYIVMEINVLVCTNIHSLIYFLCITIVPYHYHTMHFTHSKIMPKSLKNKLSTPFINLFHETFHSHNKLFSSNDGVFKCPKHPFFYQPKRN
jgi:hypothetical protein